MPEHPELFNTIVEPQSGVFVHNRNPEKLEFRLQQLLSSCSGVLEAASVDNVRHYIGVGEYEMAFESLVLSLIGEGIAVSREMRGEIGLLGEELNMATEAVFRQDFWAVASSWVMENS